MVYLKRYSLVLLHIVSPKMNPLISSDLICSTLLEAERSLSPPAGRSFQPGRHPHRLPPVSSHPHALLAAIDEPAFTADIVDQEQSLRTEIPQSQLRYLRCVASVST